MGRALEAQIRKLQDLYWSDVDPNGRGFVPLADALRKAEDFTEAHRVLNEGLARCPDSASGHVVAAWLYRDEGELEEAALSFEAALDLDARNVAALEGLAGLLEERGDREGALRFWKDLLRENPSDGELRARIQSLEAGIAEPGEFPTKPELGGELPEGGGPGAFARFAEELDWEKAALQEDRPYLGSRPADPAQRELGQDRGVWLAEEGVPVPEVRDRQDFLVTPTLGEIYFRQGLLGRAEEVFEALLARDPGNETLEARLEAVRAAQRGEEPGVASGVAKEVWGREPADLEGFGPEEAEGIPPGALGHGDSPEVAVESLGPPDSEVVSIRSLAPEAAVVVGIDALAPVASEVVSVHTLAPGVAPGPPDGPPGPEAVFPIQSLAPGELDVVSIESLAPDSDGTRTPEGDDSSGDDPRLNAFQDWLDELP